MRMIKYQLPLILLEYEKNYDTGNSRNDYR